ncbi:MAG: hypothetical protein HQ518_00200 [Rhodopirellula sp.]|nr:hypothetical protein [Rhodopirellula sp.]
MSQIFRQLADRGFAVRCVLVASCIFALAVKLDAAPTIQSLSVRGLQVSGTTTIRVTGTDLLPNPRLLLSVPIAKQTVKPNATATQVEFDVTLDGSVSPGIYNLWVVSDSGATPTAIVAADQLPNLAFGPEVPSLPASLHGVVSGSQKLRTVFSATKGQVVLLEVESQRLGGKLRPVLHIYDSANKHLQWSLPSSVLRGDTRLQFTAPADGKYTVELHDLQYAAPAPNYFRLKIGAWQYADLAFPPAVERANPAQVELIGNLAVGHKVAVVPNESPEAPPVMMNAASGAFRPSVLISDITELAEAAPAEGLQQLPAVPFGISGRLLSEGEQDRYKLTVTAGAKLRFKVFADQLGAPMDAVLQILNEQGGQLAINDDVAGSADPSLDYVIPADTTNVVLAIKEANGIGSPNNVYRIHVSDVTNEASTSDFQLSIAEQEQSVTAGEHLVVKVIVERVNYAGPIRLQFDSLPDGIQTQGAMIAAGADSTLLTLHGAGLATSHALTSLRGVAEIADRKVVRYVTGATHPLSSMQPWLGRELALALAAPSEVDFDFGWGRIDADTQLALGGKLDVPLQFFRPAGSDGPVRVTVVFSQKPILVNGNVDANRTMRSETNQPVEMAVDATAQQAWDAKLAADKSLATATTAQVTVAQTTVRATADAEANLKTAVAQLTAAMEVAKLAETQAKAATDTVAASSVVLAKVIAKVQSVATANNTAAGDTVSKSAEAVAAAAAELQAAAASKANAQKAASAAAAKFKEAGLAVTMAQATATQADAAVKAAQAAEVKAKADAETAVKAALAQQTAAAAAADNAARLAKNTGAFAIFVPADLPQPGYEVAFKAELLSRDKKTVVATRYSEVRRLPTLNPIVLAPSTPGQIAAVIDAQAGATVAVSGKVNRLAGMDQDVTVSLVGLPAGIAVPTATVKADQTDYTLEMKFPATFKPAELTGIRVFATGKMRVNAPIAVRSQELPVVIRLTAPPMPAEKK